MLRCCLSHSTASAANAKCIMEKQLQYMSRSQLTNEPWKSCQLGTIRLHSLSLLDCLQSSKRTNPLSSILSGCPVSRGEDSYFYRVCEYLPARYRGVTNSSLITSQLCNVLCNFSLLMQREGGKGDEIRAQALLLHDCKYYL